MAIVAPPGCVRRERARAADIMMLLICALFIRGADGYRTARVFPPLVSVHRGRRCGAQPTAAETGFNRSLSFGDRVVNVPGLVDTALACTGAGTGIILLNEAEKLTSMTLYAPPLAAAAIIIFSGIKPPPLKNVFLGTLGASTFALLLYFGGGGSPETRALAVAGSLLWFKSSGALFPPVPKGDRAPPPALCDTRASFGCLSLVKRLSRAVSRELEPRCIGGGGGGRLPRQRVSAIPRVELSALPVHRRVKPPLRLCLRPLCRPHQGARRRLHVNHDLNLALNDNLNLVVRSKVSPSRQP
jgi:hypothetical protein